MTEDQITAIIREIPENVVTQVAVNTTDIINVKDDIHEIRDDIKNFRRESREDAKSMRQGMLAFAVAISAPLIAAAIKVLSS